MSIKCCIIPFYDIYLKLQSTDFSKVYGFFITDNRNKFYVQQKYK